MPRSAKTWYREGERCLRFARHGLAAHAELQANSRVITEAHDACERFLKAALLQSGAYAPRTHELTELLDLLIESYPLWSSIRQELEAADRHYRLFRYDGEDAMLKDAEAVLAVTEVVRALVKVVLKE